MQKTALVLSGGGALGAYEVGVWKALRQMNIKFDIVTGTSVGALNAIMVVQKDFRKCLNVWQNISFANIYKDNINQNIDIKSLYKKYAKEFLKNGGMNPIMLENLVDEVYDENKFYKSKIDYGIITVNARTLKPKMLTKKDIKPDKLVDYAIASATCFPAFKMKQIDNEKYIDGGYYDNMPINLAIDMGAQRIIAVDLQAMGFKRRIKKFDGTIDIVKPKNKLMNVLEFNAQKSKRAINMGYNDTLKYYKLLDGDKFTFKKNHLRNNYKRNINNFKDILRKIVAKESNNKVANAILNKYNIIFFDTKTQESEFNKIVENCGKLFKLKDDPIYSIRKYNKKIVIELNLVDDFDYKKIKSSIKNISKKTIVKIMYNMIKDGLTKELFALANLFSSEFFMAVYFATIS